MAIISDLFTILAGIMLFYIGILSFVGSVLSRDLSERLGYEHGKWVRELFYKKMGNEL